MSVDCLREIDYLQAILFFSFGLLCGACVTLLIQLLIVDGWPRAIILRFRHWQRHRQAERRTVVDPMRANDYRILREARERDI